ncbi:hypothetical protein [Actinokineospora sp. NBRC 105648]|uniref:hypothetical protein n=1 Tax=Actinokineospora sp. NBRC 105648 TaxID=3032206 RepID=UPI0024A4BA6C|nr:hypothetical protein [Actinokineospora sp. NBRC 105648]GLZ39980.1 hypothetical protein Acsp05_36040 [Actinokineospora sp. NBRC 105648]
MTTTDTGEPTEQVDAPRQAPVRRRGPSYLVIVLSALALVAAGFAVWFAVAWVTAGNDDDLDIARMRDEVARVGSAAIVTLNTLDYRQVDQDLDRWVSTSTGQLRDEVTSRRASSKSTIEQAKTVTTATVLKIAVTSLADREGKAEVIAAVRVEVTPEGKAATPKYLRIQATLDRTADGWKLSGIGYVPFTPAG